MSHVSRTTLAIIGLLSAVGVAMFFVLRPPHPAAPPEMPPSPPPTSILAPASNWKSLDAYQKSITREEFESLLTQVFTTGDAWRGLIEIDEREARIATGDTAPNEPLFRLEFAQPGEIITSPSRHWRRPEELPVATVGRPLGGLKIAIDPGHIGGKWAKMEERWFVVGDGAPVQEGDMTLRVANLLKPRLEALGATVELVRETLEPVTSIRPKQLELLATTAAPAGTSAVQIRRNAERLFYRTAEIRARAEVVNGKIRPDLVLCLHFNAEAWGDPAHPLLIDRTHLHLLVNGAYNDEEILLADQRYAMLLKLLQRTHREEVSVGAAVASAFAEASGLPPYIYPADSKSALPIPGQPYLWARNLLANRLYDCPVIFLEPYVMNSVTDYTRIQAGDYEGVREISGKLQPSIFHEYADAVARGLANHFASRRGN